MDTCKCKVPDQCIVPVDRRRLLSVISDIKRTWKGGADEEYSAMEHGILTFHEWLVKGGNINVEDLDMVK